MNAERISHWRNADRPTREQAWIEFMGHPPPKRLSRPLMANILICELQWEASGQSRQAIVREYERAVHADTWKTPKAPSGTRLVREWNGKEHIIDVTDDGFFWNDQSWTSLTAIATAITGTKWSGPRFFGVRP